MPKSKPSNKVFGSKSAFVRGLPKEMPAKEVVAKAKAEGMSLSVAQVYNIRSTAKLKKGTARKGKAAAPAASGGTARVSGNAEAQLRKLVAEIGLARTREVMAELSSAFAG